MKTICFVLCLSAVPVSQAHAVDYESFKRERVLEAMQRVETRFGVSLGLDDLDDTTLTCGTGVAVVVAPKFTEVLGAHKTIRIMKYNVKIQTLKTMAKAIWRQKISIKLSF